MSVQPVRQHVATTPDVALADHDTHAATEVRHLDDMMLRAAGFRIFSRPARGEPLWTRNHKLFRQSEAVDITAYEGERQKEAG